MLTWLQGIILALLQGVTELFPISSLGHTVLLPLVLGWGAITRQTTFVPLVVVLHLGTASALLWFYRARWTTVSRAFVASAVRGRLSHTPEEHLAWMLFFGTLPAGIIGAVLEKPLKDAFGKPLVAAVFLTINGAIMLGTEWWRRRACPARVSAAGVEQEEGRGIADLTWREALAVGAAQALALLPGLSRSGMTICAGLAITMRHQDAADFSFMLATPLIAAAGLLEAPTLITEGRGILGIALVGGLLSALTAYLSVRFLHRYFRLGSLAPFGYYCLAIGLAALLYLGVHGA
ncbi:MAG: undecaprenyl-diphosphate phosphatase [Chloroflexota bacterium]